MLKPRVLSAELRDPAQVLDSLNETLPMEAHDDMYFTMWYGVYSAATRSLTYACGGHHPGSCSRWGCAGDARHVGADDRRDTGVSLRFATGADSAKLTFYLFSDGAFETTAPDGRRLGLDDFLPLLSTDGAGSAGEAERIYRSVRSRSRPGPLDDDFSLLVVSVD